MGQTVLDQMIDEELIRQEAAKRGITASKAEVDQAIQASYQYYPEWDTNTDDHAHRGSAPHAFTANPGIGDDHADTNGRC